MNYRCFCFLGRPIGGPEHTDACNKKRAYFEAHPEDLTILYRDELQQMTDRHYEQVVCSSCKEWTEYGESCCGMTECESECPICKELT